MQPSELTNREQSAVRFEKHTPAYARTIENRRAVDDLYRQSRKLRAMTGMQHQVMAMIPFESEFVSGLNVPANLHICVADGRKPVDGQLWSGISAHRAIQRKALSRLSGRNDG